jgi:mannose-6-phosphate isomerase-like protein (cupin superfamily)
MKLTFANAMQALEAHQENFPAPCHESTFVQLFQNGTMDIEFYKPEGGDLQQPHEQDEVYFIASGSSRFEHAGTIEEVTAGDVVFVAAGEEHRFVDFSNDFSTWVVLYGPAGGE